MDPMQTGDLLLFLAMATQGHITKDDQKGGTNGADSGKHSWHFNSLCKTPETCCNTTRAVIASTNERAFHPNFFSNSTPFP